MEESGGAPGCHRRNTQLRTKDVLGAMTVKVGKKLGGAEGIRTPDPLNAIEVLSQLSYSPT